jgi:hypothetical protein
LLFGFGIEITVKNQHIDGCHLSIVVDMVEAEFFPVHRVKAYGGINKQLHSLSSTLDVGKLSASRANRFTPRERFLVAHGVECRMCHRAGLDTMGKKINTYRLLGIEPRLIDCTASCRFLENIILGELLL